MTVLKHKTPCKECPFRKASLSGWLGSSTPYDFVITTLSEDHMPCHLTIDYEQRNWQKQLPKAAHCAGSLIFLKNSCKIPRDKVLAARVKAVDKSDNVFSSAQSFIDHHVRTLVKT